MAMFAPLRKAGRPFWWAERRRAKP